MKYHIGITGRFCSLVLEDREFVFPTGATMITGRNGTGKSSLLKALSFCLFDKALNDGGVQASRPDGLYTLRLVNHIFSVECGRTQKEGLIYKGEYNGNGLNGERQDNIAKFQGWLGIRPGQAFDTLIGRVQFSQASPSIFALTERKLLESVTSSLSERTKEYQRKYDSIKAGHAELGAALKQAKREAELLSGSKFASTAELESEIRLVETKIAKRPEPSLLPHLQGQLAGVKRNLDQIQKNYAGFVANAEKRIAQIKTELVYHEFDEALVRKERDKVLLNLVLIEQEIRDIKEQIAYPKTCPKCETPLLARPDKFEIADVAAIERAERLLVEKGREKAEAIGLRDNTDQTLKFVGLKRELEQLQVKLVEKDRECALAEETKRAEIEVLEISLRHCTEAKPLWDELANLQHRLRTIQEDNARFERIAEQALVITKLEKSILAHDFNLHAGVRDLLLQHFTDQCVTFSAKVNEVLRACDLGQIEFVPEFGGDSNVEKIRLRHLDKGEWLPYAEREASMKVMLDFAAWITNIQLNPQEVDKLKLIMLDDFCHAFEKRLENILGYLGTLPVVLLFSWANKQAIEYLKPVQIIELGV